MELLSTKLPQPIKPLLQATNPAQSQAAQEFTTLPSQAQEYNTSLTTHQPPTHKIFQLTKPHHQAFTKQAPTKVAQELDLESIKAELGRASTKVELDLESTKVEHREFTRQEADQEFTNQAPTKVEHQAHLAPTKLDRQQPTKAAVASLVDMEHLQHIKEDQLGHQDRQEFTKAEPVDLISPTNLDHQASRAATNLEPTDQQLEPQEHQEHQGPHTPHRLTNTRRNEG